MLILGIILIIVGFIVPQWATNAQKKTYLKPPVFNSTAGILAVNLFWLSSILAGFYILWQVDVKIVLVILGVYASLWVFGYFMGNEKAKAKRIFKIYKHLRLFRPKASEYELFRETAEEYFRGLGWDKRRIKLTMTTIFDEGMWGEKNYKNIKDVAGVILSFEDPYEDFNDFNLVKLMEHFSKRQKAINEAYEDVFGNLRKVVKRPKLSEATINWLKSIGLNPDEMSNEQLAAFLEMDDYRKSSWLVVALYKLSLAFLILAGINLITFKFIGVLSSCIISFMFWYIGHRIQMRRTSKKFYEASILKYVQEQIVKQGIGKEVF